MPLSWKVQNPKLSFFKGKLSLIFKASIAKSLAGPLSVGLLDKQLKSYSIAFLCLRWPCTVVGCNNWNCVCYSSGGQWLPVRGHDLLTYTANPPALFPTTQGVLPLTWVYGFKPQAWMIAISAIISTFHTTLTCYLTCKFWLVINFAIRLNICKFSV